MKIRNAIKSFPIIFAAVFAAVICMILTAVSGKWWLAVIEFLLIAAMLVLLLVKFKALTAKKQKMMSSISMGFDYAKGETTNNFPIPVVVCTMNGEIKWFNDLFEKSVIGKHDSNYNEFSTLFSDMGIDAILDSADNGISIDCDGKSFTVFSHKSNQDGESVVVMYLFETTKYRRIADEFVRTRPVMAIMTIDNMNEIAQSYRESDAAAIRNGISKEIEQWVAGYSCFVKKFNGSNFYIVTDKASLDDMMERKFDILDTARGYTYDGKYAGVTLSIGVGSGLNYAECEKNAKLSLDMAYGRGGDQAVIRNKEDYSFFGGISKSVDTGNKVKSRVIASALSELMQGCDNVFVMGHRFPDFDAMGAAFGVACIAKSLSKNAYIVTDYEKSAAKSLLENIDEDFEDCIVDSDFAKSKLGSNKKSLLVVVDTHIKTFVEYPELLELSKMTVVIDHHRKAVDYIDNAVIFFHDPSASSTSEMVTELIEYIPATTNAGSFVADALLAGIMLDTKNFVLRSSSDTFQAAAFLKTQGAEAVRVKKLFSTDIESYHIRNSIVNSAEKYKNCVIAVTDSTDANIRVLSAQAADELLTVSGVDASFVIFRTGDTACISARSYGALNVQLIMEYLDGGGHQTMAAAQLKDTTTENAKAKLIESIDNYQK